MELHLPPDTEAKLRARAAALGMNMEEFAVETIKAKVDVSDESRDAEVMLPRDKWKAKFAALLASFPSRETKMDDSRESIYRGRGE